MEEVEGPNPKAQKPTNKPTWARLLNQILATFALFNTLFRHNDTSSATFDTTTILLNSTTDNTSAVETSSVKVFLYDLPLRFTYGVIAARNAARGGRQLSDDDDVSSLHYPGHQHMAEWYIFTDLSRPESERLGSPVTRVMNPDEADLFYVPFFSSLSLTANTVGPKDGTGRVYRDPENQEAVMEWLEGQEHWRRNNGRDHVIVASDPNALWRVLDRVKNSVLLVSDFGRLKEDQGSLVKDVIVPYSHRIRSYRGEIGVENRNTLLFFMGNRFRKEGGKIRDTLFQILENEENVIIKHGTQSTESRRAASHGMHTSKFCLHPAGDTPSACRLFDAIVSLCVPVVVSDYIELPFEDVIDYRKIAIFVESEPAVKPGFLVSKLRAITPDRILEYQKEMKEVKRYFEYGDPDGTVNEIWRQVVKKLPFIKLMSNRDKRLIVKEIKPDLSGFQCGLAHLFLHHTSASLTINENYDYDVRDDTETFLNRIVPEGPSAPWKHTLEGPDDMPAHIKSSMFGCALMIPISNGRLNMGTWQGIWLCEHRDYPTSRTVVVTLNGI